MFVNALLIILALIVIAGKTVEEILIAIYSEEASENKKNFLKLVDYSESKEVRAMKEYAQQERENAVNQFKKRVIREIIERDEFIYDILQEKSDTKKLEEILKIYLPKNY